MLSIEQCSKVLNKNKRKYTNEEVKEIRESLTQITNLLYELKYSKNE
jgi:hypothetical protein